MVESQCAARPVKAYIMSDLLKKFDTTNDFVKIAVAVVGFYMGMFYMEYVDTEYSLWLTWFLTPVIVTFLLPAVLIILIYISSIIFYLYRLYRLKVVDGVQNDWRQAARVAVCALWDAHGWLWHGYEIRGVEHIPQGPFLVIYYHGALPIDMYYFTARIMLFQRRLIHTVADRLLFKIPGWKSLLEGLCVIPGTVQTCAGVLRSGNPLAISPGGVYEAQFGDHYYKLKWKSRIGFAKVAHEAKVPIIPMFTQNVREAFRTVGWLRGVWLRIYSAVRVPLAPVYGGFPVKLITHLGPPIYPEDEDTPEVLQKKVAAAIEKLIEEHQRVPGNIFTALIERVYELPKNKHKSEKLEKQEENSEKLPANSEKLPANSEILPANSEKLPGNSEKLPENSEIIPANSQNLTKVSENHTNGKCHNGVVKVTDNAQSDSESGKQKVS